MNNLNRISKVTLIILMAILGLLLTFISISGASNRELEFYTNLERQYCGSFLLPNVDALTHPDVTYAVLSETARETGCNIVRTSLRESEGGYEILRFLLVASEDSRYLQALGQNTDVSPVKLNTFNRDSELFMSTMTTESDLQVGVINSHMRGLNVTFYPLGQQFHYMKADGVYYVNLASDISAEEFNNVLLGKIHKHSGLTLSAEDLSCSTSTSSNIATDNTFYIVVWGIIFVFFVLFLSYSLLRRQKEIAVIRLMGQQYSTMFSRFFRECLIVYPILLLILSFFLWIKNQDMRYTWLVTKYSWLLFPIIIVIFILSFTATVKGTAISEALKGKSLIGGVLVIQTLVQVISILLILYAGGSAFTYLLEARALDRSNKQWAASQEYAVFYPLYTGDEQSIEEIKEREKVLSGDLYEFLNEQGALLVNAGSFTNEAKANDLAPDMPYYTNSLAVNPNYLERFPVYDKNGKAINIEESENDVILIVPVQYEQDSQNIENYYFEVQMNSRKFNEEYHGVKYSENATQDVKIIWSESGQRCFPFNRNVEDNVHGLEDPIIQVFTLNNSTHTQRQGILGQGDTDALKIKINGDSKNTYAAMEDKLRELGVADNLRYLVSVDSRLAEDVAQLNKDSAMSIRILLVSLIVLCFVLYQSTAIIFDKNKKDYVVKKIFGLKWFRIYGRYSAGILVLLGFVVVLYAVFIKLGGPIFILSATIVLCLIQLLSIYICTIRQEKAKSIDVLKGN